MDVLVNDYVTNEDLKKFEDKYLSEEKLGRASTDTQFQYAYCLVRSKYKDDIRKGIDLFNDLCMRGCDQRDFLFYLGFAHYKLKEYSVALKFVQRILTIEPNNRQAEQLQDLIDKDMKKDGLFGIAMVGVAGGAAALTGILLGMLFAKKGR
eukprot:gene12885-14211_t